MCGEFKYQSIKLTTSNSVYNRMWGHGFKFVIETLKYCEMKYR